MSKFQVEVLVEMFLAEILNWSFWWSILAQSSELEFKLKFSLKWLEFKLKFSLKWLKNLVQRSVFLDGFAIYARLCAKCARLSTKYMHGSVQIYMHGYVNEYNLGWQEMHSWMKLDALLGDKMCSLGWNSMHPWVTRNALLVLGWSKMHSWVTRNALLVMSLLSLNMESTIGFLLVDVGSPLQDREEVRLLMGRWANAYIGTMRSWGVLKLLFMTWHVLPYDMTCPSLWHDMSF